MIPRFHLERPRTIGEAFQAFARDPEDSAYLAGGTELLQVMKMGLMEVGTLVDLKGIDELGGIAVAADGSLVIGALATHREIERSAVVGARLPGLASMTRRIANVRVRSTGTLAGNLAFAEPHSDPATFLLACGATVALLGPNGRRSLTIDSFITGPLATARDRDEIVGSIHIPATPAGTGRAFAKIAFFERPAVSVAVSATVADGVIVDADVVVGSLTDVPQRVAAARGSLAGLELSRLEADIGEIARALAGQIEPYPDLNGSVDYKRHLAATLIGRVTMHAVEQAAA